jgi:hypothetical protein
VGCPEEYRAIGLQVIEHTGRDRIEVAALRDAATPAG